MTNKNTHKIHIVEVGPRDGLQNEKTKIPTSVKVAFVNALSHSGLSEIETSAFVSPQWVPQLSDAVDVFSEITRNPSVLYSALVPNMQGLEMAQKAHVKKIAVFTSATDSFNRHNINTDIEGSFARIAPVIEKAKASGMQVRGYVSVAFWCPYEGRVMPERVVPVAERLRSLGCDEISIGDTIGKAIPEDVDVLLNHLLAVMPVQTLALHFHDTFGNALTNVMRGFERGVTIFDTSVGGLGGCPYAPSARGNVATEQVVAWAQSKNISCDVNISVLHEASALLKPYLPKR